MTADHLDSPRSINMVALLYRHRNASMCVVLIKRRENGHYNLYPVSEFEVQEDLKSFEFQDKLRETMRLYAADRGVSYWMSGKTFQLVHSILSGNGAFARHALDPMCVDLTSAKKVVETYAAWASASGRDEHQVIIIKSA
ncbi:hypothetical protein [Rhizobium sp. MHM7A]|uniref:hypothetical protein n=1 Tax=Rhizobium sp. MHM7A TaxID=2583233 RepID=UPI001106DC76|nr:hypothetical protein [Rhizobium sp. MHM7A]TLX16306.1 hypothetical protein FFR93_02970 [Rhizobium sp. MHM7A]